MHAAIIDDGPTDPWKIICSKRQCLEAIDRYWMIYANMNGIETKSYNEIKHYIKETHQYVDELTLSASKFLSRTNCSLLLDPIKMHFYKDMQGILQFTMTEYIRRIYTEINDVLITKRALSIMLHIRLIKHRGLIRDDSSQKLKLIPDLIKELSIAPYAETAASLKIRSYIVNHSLELDILMPNIKHPPYETTTNTIVSVKRNFLNKALDSIKTIVRSEIEDANTTGPMLNINDQFSIKSLKESPQKTVTVFVKVWHQRNNSICRKFIMLK